MHKFCKTIKKGWKILLVILAVFLIITSAAYISLRSKGVQTFITQKIANIIAEKINTKIVIGGVDIGFFNRIVLKDVLIEDLQNDTLVYAERLSARIDSFSYKKRSIALKQVRFIHTSFSIDKVPGEKYNYQFIIDSLTTGLPGENEIPVWNVTCRNFEVHDAKVSFNIGTFQNKNNIYANQINFNVNNFTNNKDSLYFDLEDMSLTDGKEFFLDGMKAHIVSSGGKTSVGDLAFETTNSRVSDAYYEIVSDTLGGGLLTYSMDLNLEKSSISFIDLAMFIPVFKGMDQQMDLSGRIYGNLNDLKGKNIVIKTGDYTSLNFDFYINDLTDPENMYLFLDLQKSQTDFRDIKRIKLPVGSKFENITFPEPFYDAGKITYEGNFSGFLTDFVAYGTLQSKMGTITSDLSFVPQKNGNIQMKGKLATSDFEIGNLLNNELLGKVSFNGEVYGIYNKIQKSVDGTFDGIISSIDLNKYTYRNIILDGAYFEKKFEGKINIDDPNLSFDFAGELNLKPKVPIFNFDLYLYKADLIALNLDPINKSSELSFILKANFKGNSIDNMEGVINVENGNYRNENGNILLRGITLTNSSYGGKDSLHFISDFAEATIDGAYQISSIKKAFKNILANYIPSYKPEKLLPEEKNIFQFNLSFNKLDEITRMFIPELTILTPFEINGAIDSDKKTLDINGHIPGATYKNMAVKDIIIYTNSEDQFQVKIKCNEFHTEEGFNIYNLALNSNAADDKLNTRLTWNNFHHLSYCGEINTETYFTASDSDEKPKVKIDIEPSKVYIADSLWNIESSHVTIDSTSISVNNFCIHKKNQSVYANGKISEDKSNRLELTFENIRLRQFEEYLQTETGLKGVLNGTVGVTDVYGDSYINSDLKITGLMFRGQEIGDVSIFSKWNNESSVVNTNLIVENNNSKQLIVTGYYKPKNDSLDFTANLDHLSVVLLEKVMGQSFSNIHGEATGSVKIHGNSNNILLDGALYGSNAGLTLDYLQVGYSFNDSVKFAGNAIIFDKIEVSDVYGNKGIFDGSIVHTNFHSMIYDMSLSSRKIMVMNTRPKDNERFYGKIFAAGTLYITGQGLKIDLDGDATTLSGTAVNISLDYEEDVETYDFIQFVNNEAFKEEEVIFNSKPDTAMNMNLTIHATPEAKAQIIYNAKIGDIIKAEGEGVLRFGMDKDGNITLYGDYNVEQGEYLFTLQNVINKKFTIDKGGSIIWSGDPYNANIDIKAIYSLKASLMNLNGGSRDNSFISSNNSYSNIDYSQRIQVNCQIILTENLMNPNIKFNVNFPMAEDRMVDDLKQYFNTDEEMNKQILSLLVLGQFYTPEYMRGTYEATSTNVLGATASELFSNQLSNWLSQISKDVDIGLNYRPGNQLTNDEIEFALSTQMFNDRVIINGNIGNNINPSVYNNHQIVGDFDLNVKLSKNGKLQLKAYNRSNNNLIYETAPYTQGIGFSYKEEFNTLEDLVQKFISLFSK